MGSLYGVASLTFVQIAAAPDKWQPALAAVVEELARAHLDGLSDEDIARLVAAQA
jgi:zinc protease